MDGLVTIVAIVSTKRMSDGVVVDDQIIGAFVITHIAGMTSARWSNDQDDPSR